MFAGFFITDLRLSPCNIIRWRLNNPSLPDVTCNVSTNWGSTPNNFLLLTFDF